MTVSLLGLLPDVQPASLLGLKTVRRAPGTSLTLDGRGLTGGGRLVKFGAPLLKPPPLLLHFSPNDTPRLTRATLLNWFGENERRRGVLAIWDETRTELSGPFSLVISFAIPGLARPMRSLSELLGSQRPVWCTPFLLRPLSNSSVSPPPARRGSINPGRTSWRVDGIGRRLEDRPGGIACLCQRQASTRSTHPKISSRALV